MCFANRKSTVGGAKHVEVLWFDAVEYVFVFSLAREIEGQERDILQHLFSEHPLLCVCIC